MCIAPIATYMYVSYITRIWSYILLVQRLACMMIVFVSNFLHESSMAKTKPNGLALQDCPN